jgi:hypothetical protein
METINEVFRFIRDGDFRMSQEFDPTEMKPHSTIELPLTRTIVREYALKSLSIVRGQVFLRVHRVSRVVGIEIGKIYKTQNHTKLAKETLVSNGIGLLLGMLSAQFVSRFFDVRGLHNLWGILSKQTLVSRNTYEVLCFAAEFFVALLVFTLTDHFIREYRSRREKREQAGSDSTKHG